MPIASTMELKGLFLYVVITFLGIVQADNHEKSQITEDLDPFILKRYQLECIEETRVDPDLIGKIKRGKFQEKPDPLVKMWALCTLMKAGLMTPQGVYKMDTALARLPPHDADHVSQEIDKCLHKKAIPPIDIAYKFIKCYKRKPYFSSVSILT